jgi:hypothetical protein
MIVPCAIVAHHAAVRLLHRVVHAVGQAHLPVRHLGIHPIRHVGQALVNHARMATTAVCHVAPGALALTMLALSPASSSTHEVLLPSAISSEQMPLREMAAVAPNRWVEAKGGSTIITFLPLSDLPSIAPGPRALAPAPPSSRTGLSSKTPTMSFPILSTATVSLAEGPQTVPEPASLLVFATALCGLGMAKQRSLLHRQETARHSPSLSRLHVMTPVLSNRGHAIENRKGSCQRPMPARPPTLRYRMIRSMGLLVGQIITQCTALDVSAAGARVYLANPDASPHTGFSAGMVRSAGTGSGTLTAPRILGPPARAAERTQRGDETLAFGKTPRPGRVVLSRARRGAAPTAPA